MEEDSAGAGRLDRLRKIQEPKCVRMLLVVACRASKPLGKPDLSQLHVLLKSCKLRVMQEGMPTDGNISDPSASMYEPGSWADVYLCLANHALLLRGEQ